MAALGLDWRRVPARFLPFADAASPELPWPRLLRLSLFQVTVGLSAVLLTGTLNRVMIVELGLPAALVALMVALPLVFAPLRAALGHASDHHRSFLGWRRVPYLWFGTLLQFSGFAILPFALLVMSGDGPGSPVVGQIGAALGFLLVGAGMHTVQTAGLALATDLAPEAKRPRVVAALYAMLLVGMLVAALVIGGWLADFTAIRLIQAIQGAAVVTMLLNCAALWKQEARQPVRTRPGMARPAFRDEWRAFAARPGARRWLWAVALGAAGFAMQDVLLEPYGAQVFALGVGQTTWLTAAWASGMLAGFAIAARRLAAGGDPHRAAALGALVGVAGLCALVMAAPLESRGLLAVATLALGAGCGLFAVGALSAAMAFARDGGAGLALGAWGAANATAAGVGVLAGGALRDWAGAAALAGRFGEALALPSTGYIAVYHLEIGLLFAAVVALGPLAAHREDPLHPPGGRFGLPQFPS
jgi:BCD family chlorophyll transporter-like MFS transporter